MIILVTYILTQPKIPRHWPYSLLQTLPVPLRPWKSISLDFITNFPPSQGYNVILIVVDHFIKMLHFLPRWKLLPISKWHIFCEKYSNIMVSQINSLVIMGHNLLRNFGYTYLRSLKSRVNSLHQANILKQTVKISAQIKP